jgi:hypothetical protein
MKKVLVAIFAWCLFSPGVYAQEADTTLLDFKIKYAIAPVSLAAAGLITQGKFSRHFQREIYSQYPNYRTKVDDYLQYLPGAVNLSLGASGVKGKHSFGDQIILTILSNLIAQGVTQSLKRIVSYPRPNGEDNHSFPSGHATAAFANATLLHEEYGQRSVWYSIGGYGTATAVGTMRLFQNEHWVSDVLFGAGVGIGATKLVYISYPWLKKNIRFRKKRSH